MSEESRSRKKRGYLNQNFRIFHLRDKKEEQYEYHYHEFNKIILLLSGKVTYIIEGKTYFLKPWDILLVNHHDIHRPVIDATEDYERIVIWIDPDYLERMSEKGDDLQAAFRLAGRKRLNLVRLESALQEQIRELMIRLESAADGSKYASGQLAEALLIQLLVYLNRVMLGEEESIKREEDTLKYDPRIEGLLKYINEHLREELSIDELAARCFVSRFYLMHRFKEETGYTIYNYIMQKRLLLARDMLLNGKSAAQVADECGFHEYSAFLRAFKKNFGMTPTEYVASGGKQIENILD